MVCFLSGVEAAKKRSSVSLRLRVRYLSSIDGAIGLYAIYIILLLAASRSIPEWPILIVLHVGILVVLVVLPPRGACWERTRTEPLNRSVPRRVGVLLRHMYPLAVILFFFEEGQYIVNMLHPNSPYWFEKHLYAADHWLFGDHPSVVLLPYLSWPLNELMHFFYFSYFVVLVFGPLMGRMPPGGSPGRPWRFNGPGFEAALGGMVMGFLCAFIWYPWIPARGPFENTELMSSLPRFSGGPFTYLARRITDGAAVSGNCFPSAHVAGTWGLTFGLADYHPRLGMWMGVLAVGISVSCTYTRYHHFVDVPAGFLMGLTGFFMFYLSESFRGRTSS